MSLISKLTFFLLKETIPRDVTGHGSTSSVFKLLKTRTLTEFQEVRKRTHHLPSISIEDEFLEQNIEPLYMENKVDRNLGNWFIIDFVIRVNMN